MDFLELAKMRCTTRGFETTEIPQTDLDYILSVERVAPTACNRQPQRIIVARHPESIAKVGKAYKTFDSSCILIVCRDVCPQRGRSRGLVKGLNARQSPHLVGR